MEREETDKRSQKDVTSSLPEVVTGSPVTKSSTEERMVKENDSATSASSAAASSTSTSGSWSWGSFLQKATTDLVGKSTAVVEFMKRDLSEFTETMQKDTAIIVNDATQSFKDKMTMEEAGKAAGLVKSGISSFFGTINASLSLFDEQHEANEAAKNHHSRAQARLAAVQNDPNTFKREPAGRPEDFETWLMAFDINKQRPEMDRLLDSVDAVQDAYNQFVPSIVTHNEFWQRYFYRLYQLEKEEKRIQSLMARSDDQTSDDLGDWGDELDDAPYLSQSMLLDPSEASSVVSNESFQMVGHDPILDRDVEDAILVESSRAASGHKKQESISSLGEWDHEFEEPNDEPQSRDDTPTPD